MLRASAQAQIDAGVLLVREPGSPTRAARDLGPDEGLPRIHTAGRFLAGSGRYFPGLAREVSADELPVAVAEELAWSGRWAKVIGDFFGDDGTMSPVFPTEVLVEAAAVAHSAGGRITMHCMTIAGLEQAIEAGFDSVEHATSITPELIGEMARISMTWVPTISIIEPVRQIILANPSSVAQAILAGFDDHADMVCQAATAGVRVLAGTDAGVVPHGSVAAEIGLLAAAGLSSTDALAAGSWEARRYLGLPLIEDGAPADLVIYPDDPTADLDVLGHPSLVMIDGQIVKGG